MLTKLITSTYGVLIEIALWVVLLVAAVAGFNYVGPELAGGYGDSLGMRIIGASIAVLTVFVAVCIFVGPLLLLLDIRRSLRRLEELNELANPRRATAQAAADNDIPEARDWKASR